MPFPRWRWPRPPTAMPPPARARAPDRRPRPLPRPRGAPVPYGRADAACLRCLSRAQGARAAVTSVAGLPRGAGGRLGDRQDALPARAVQAIGVRPEAEGRAEGRQHRHRGGRVTLGRGVVVVGAEELPRIRLELRAEQVAQRDRTAALFHHADRLGRRELAGSPAGPATAGAGRPARSCPGPGRSPPRPPRRMVRSRRTAVLRQRTDCVAGDPVGHVVRADHDRADVRHSRRIRQHLGDLPLQVVRPGPGRATLRRSTGRSATAARPDASRAPGVWPALRTP